MVVFGGSNNRGWKEKYLEIHLNDEIRELGFIKVSIHEKNIVILFQDKYPVVSTFRLDEIERTTKALEKKMITNGITSESAQRLIHFLTTEFLAMLEDERKRQEEVAASSSKSEGGNSSREADKIAEEISKDKSELGKISLEEWEKVRAEKYNRLKNTVNSTLPSLWLPLEFTLSIKSIMNIKKITLPFAGIILGAPSTLKTVSLIMLRVWPQTFYTDSFTPKSIVSHSTAVTEEELQEIDMLPRWKNKLVLLPELAPTFTAKEDDLTNLLGILTRVLDGDGYVSNSGGHGQRGYAENIMFTLVGASVDIPYKVYKLLGYLGPKLYFLRIPKTDKDEDASLKELREDFGEKRAKVQAALFQYLKWLEIRPDMEIDKESSLPKVKWASYRHSPVTATAIHDIRDEEIAELYIVKLAKLLAHLRGVALTWETQGSQGSEYSYTQPIIEDPSRAATQLQNLSRGHALLHGRNYITREDIPIVIKTVLSTGVVERVSIFDKLLREGGTLTTSQITAFLNVSANTAKRTMVELVVLGLVTTNESNEGTPYNKEKKIYLKEEFNWFLSKEFKELREGFVPADNHEEMNGEDDKGKDGGGKESDHKNVV